MFGINPPPQSESTGFHPRRPYACAKVFGHHITVNHRESYGLMRPAEYSVIMNHPGGVKLLSPARLPARWPTSNEAARTLSILAIWMRGVTGAMLRITSGLCG